MSDTIINKLRSVLAEQEALPYPERMMLYRILGVVRGNDDEDEYRYKELTVAIRAYLGFNNSNCDGATPFNMDGTVWLHIGTVKNLAEEMLGYTGSSHYKLHLRWAIEAIGKDEFFKFIDGGFKI